MLSKLLYLPVILLFIYSSVLAQKMEHSSSSGQIQKAIVVLEPTQGNKVKGIVTFTKVDNGIQVVADIEGLTPGKHGIHIHQYGDCSDPKGESAGGHFNPMNMQHGGPGSQSRHEGDFGNITADSNGKAHMELTDKNLSFEGENSIIGHAVVIHAKEDDLKTQPSGNSGPRVACGVIGIAK